MAGKLTAVAVAALVRAGKPGAKGDGDNLFLRVTAPGLGKWTLRYMIAGKPREMGLGGYDGRGEVGLSLAQARDAAADARRLLRAGVDPMQNRKAQAVEAARLAAEAEAAAQSFKDTAAKYIAAHQSSWRSPVHLTQWKSTLATYADPIIGKKAVADVTTQDVVSILQPIWLEKGETATRLRGRIEAILDYAATRGWRKGDNPARWRGHLANLLPKRSRVADVVHHPALPWQEVGAFVSQLQGHASMAARALEFQILTATRSGELLGARRSEIDLAAGLWTIPAKRMKAKREHRVPLSAAALAVLERVTPLWSKEERDGWVFPGQKDGKPLSNMALLMLVRRMNGEPEGGQPVPWRDGKTGEPIVPHGFRSSFRDWAEEVANVPHAVSEAALAHAIGDRVEAAYRRGDLFEKRRALMADWAAFCGKSPAEIVSLRTSVAG